MARDCPRPSKVAAGLLGAGDVRVRPGTCHNCYKPGHLMRDCAEESKCHNCGKPGHVVRECTDEGTCRTCRKPGHQARQCPDKPPAEAICYRCSGAGHLANTCTSPTPPTRGLLSMRKARALGARLPGTRSQG
eukprot:TRINITY_DN1136_c0_g1_i1.p2 TRINITY_DN1136_c0_g1~~TRINITY_DN1136_c0_g1_i1.p2  ORF type:complete len:150 (-),score=6.21 TRINITY_DN1136_c0_g1_i1:357-755(-)